MKTKKLMRAEKDVTVSLIPKESLATETLEETAYTATMNNASHDTVAELDELIRQLTVLHTEMLELAANRAIDAIEVQHPSFRASARNLLHYLVLRRQDLRSLQTKLSRLGLSSLGRSEPNVLANIEAILAALHALANRPWVRPVTHEPPIEIGEGAALLARHTEELLGTAPAHRRVRIMVTMPSEAADDYSVVHELLAAGMDCMRINCAHDDADAWSRMIDHLRRAEQTLDKKCRVLMDLAGPKLRTGPIRSGPQVLKWRPERDALGRVTAPAIIWLTSQEHPLPPPAAAGAVLPLPDDWLSELKVGMHIWFADARGASRSLEIVSSEGNGRLAESRQTAYVTTGTWFRRGCTRKAAQKAKRSAWIQVGELPAQEESLLLHEGDLLILSSDLRPSEPAPVDSEGRIRGPARIGCTLPEVFADVHPGEKIWLDDGKIGGLIQSVQNDEIVVQVTKARSGGAKLRADKGINLPDSTLRLPALTGKDLADLEFVAAHADIMGFSFVNEPQDVYDLESHLERLQATHLGIILKIETRRAFEQLPELLLASMKSQCDGVMIARGDLAVECGFERLAEVQEQILWICEAAHIPVIWATQILESLAKEGFASRAEITDAAMGQRAECVMLNKGPHIVSAVHVLDDIFRRMQTHQSKKRSMLRELQVAHQRRPDTGLGAQETEVLRGLPE